MEYQKSELLVYLGVMLPNLRVTTKCHRLKELINSLSLVSLAKNFTLPLCFVMIYYARTNVLLNTKEDIYDCHI